MFDANLWNNTKADGEYAENTPPPPGTYNVTITEAKFANTGQLKDTPTIVVAYRTANGEQWADVKQLTNEGRIKSAKILMRDLGLNVEVLTTPDQIHAGLKSLEGKFFSVAVEQSNTLNTKTGQYFVNTSIIGPYQPNTAAPASAAGPPVQTPVAAGAPSGDFGF